MVKTVIPEKVPIEWIFAGREMIGRVDTKGKGSKNQAQGLDSLIPCIRYR